MKEYLVFVPVADDVHIAGVMTMPAGDARGVVVMTTGGGGVPRSHRYRLWTKVARGLAEHGIASLRTEWPGVGDSTGDLNMSFHSLPVAEIAEVARFAMAAAGTDTIGFLGNCGGARTVLQVAASHVRAESLALLLLKPSAQRSADDGASRKVRRWASTRIPDSVRPFARSVARRLAGSSRRGNPVLEALDRVRATSDVLMLEPPVQQTPRMARLAASGPLNSRRFELRDLPGPTMQSFDLLEDQRFLVDTLVAWFVDSFEPAERRRTAPLEADAARVGSGRRR